MLSKETILNHPYIPIARITLLRLEDETPYRIIEKEILDGSLQINRNNGIRRSCSLQLSNEKLDMLPNEEGFWINRKFLLELGQEINGNTVFFPQGVFVVSNPSVVSNNKSSIVTINGIDKFSLLNGQLGGNLGATYTVPVGQDINNAIRAVLAEYLDDNSQFPIDAIIPLLQDLPTEYANTPYDIIENTNIGNLLLELSGTYSRNIYYNNLGRLVFEDDILDNLKGSIWTFSTNEFLYLGATRNYQMDELYNKVIVHADNANGESWTGVAVNNNPASQTSINRLGVTRIAPIITDNLIFNQYYVDIRAKYELRKVNSLLSSVSINSVPFFGLDVDELITISDEKLGFLDEKLIIQSINIPFRNNGTMTISAVGTFELEI